MPGWFKNEENKKAAMAAGEDRIGALPDTVLQHLPSRQAVQTCVLARRWRHQWTSLPSLRINDVDNFLSAQQLNRSVHHHLLLRDETAIHECELESYDGGDIAWWYQYAVTCQCRVLHVAIRHVSYYSHLRAIGEART